MLEQSLPVTCQHGESLTTRLEDDIVTYHHANGDLCDVFNSLGISYNAAMSVNYVYPLPGRTITYAEVAIFYTSRAARQSFYVYLSTCEPDTLHHVLKMYLGLIRGSSLQTHLVSELFTVFGAHMRYNILSLDNSYIHAEELMSETVRLGCATLSSGNSDYASDLDRSIAMTKKTHKNTTS